MLSKAVGLGRDRLGLPEGCGVPHCPLPKLSWSSPRQATFLPFLFFLYFPPASEAKQNAVLTKNNNRRQIQTMDKPPVRARATRILPEEDGIGIIAVLSDICQWLQTRCPTGPSPSCWEKWLFQSGCPQEQGWWDFGISSLSTTRFPPPINGQTQMH